MWEAVKRSEGTSGHFQAMAQSARDGRRAGSTPTRPVGPARRGLGERERPFLELLDPREQARPQALWSRLRPLVFLPLPRKTDRFTAKQK